MTRTVGIIGAGAMGAGIAQVAAGHGWIVQLQDLDAAVARKAIDGVRASLDRRVEKGKLSAADRDAALQRLHVAQAREAFRECELVIEAVIEDAAVKRKVLLEIVPALKPDAIIATNTSSLSVTAIGESIGAGGVERTVGMHFFNPPPVMPLVEIIRGKKTASAVIDRAAAIAQQWGKTIVHCNDTPGFIVNRVARPYYLEAFRILEEGYAGVDEIDKAMHELGGFKMGPLELTDLIGQDVNAATTRSIWEQLGKPARLKPSKLQQQLVEERKLGRKSGRGAYLHDREPPVAALQIEKRTPTVGERLSAAIDSFVKHATKQTGTELDRYIFARVLVSIINEAAWALSENVATETDINTALKLGTNYPKGPLEWAEQIGYGVCAQLLDALGDSVADMRYEASEMLNPKV